MAIEAVITWNLCNLEIWRYFHIDVSLLYVKLTNMTERRNWSLLPSQFSKYCIYLYSGDLEQLYLLDSSQLCISPEDNSPYHLIGCVNTCVKPLSTILSKEAKLIFHFEHPSVSSCNLPGKCGFILKTVPSESVLWTMRLCTEKEGYLNEQVHFHDEIRAENMHIYFHQEWTQGKKTFKYIFPLSWLGGLAADKIKTLERRRVIGPNSRFKVLYKFK